jgi:hypothetical protein
LVAKLAQICAILGVALGPAGGLVAVAVRVRACVAVALSRGVKVIVGVGKGVNVSVAVAVGKAVAVRVMVGVAVAVGVGVGANIGTTEHAPSKNGKLARRKNNRFIDLDLSLQVIRR